MPVSEEVYAELLSVAYAEALYSVCACAVRPVRADFFAFGRRAVLQNIPAHINKDPVSQAHPLSPAFLYRFLL